MAEIKYTSYVCGDECGEEHEQELILIYDGKKKFGIANCPKDNIYFTVPANRLENDPHWKNEESVVVVNVPPEAIGGLAREIETNSHNGSSLIISPDLVLKLFGSK